MTLPIECIEEIVTRLAPLQRFHITTDFRLLFIQSRCIFLVTSMDHASRHGHMDLLDMWYAKVLTDYENNPNPRSGPDWVLASTLSLNYTTDAMDFASRNGHVHVLAWWKNVAGNRLRRLPLLDGELRGNRLRRLGSPEPHLLVTGFTLNYTDFAMDSASWYGHVHVLEWWKNSGLDLKYTKIAMATDKIHVLEWWKTSGLPLKYRSDAIDDASWYGHVHVLEWWKQSAEPYRDANGIIIHNGLELKYTNDAMRRASLNGHVHVLHWWKQSGLELKYSLNDIDYLRQCAGIDQVLEWWKQSGLVQKKLLEQKISRKVES